MKFKILATLAAVFSVSVSAQIKPITARESAKLIQYGQHPRLVDCMAVYKFDFFSNQLGFSINGDNVTETMQLAQLRVFLNTGKLEVRDPKMRFPNELKQHCSIVAQTAVEMLALKLLGKPNENEEEAQTN